MFNVKKHASGECGGFKEPKGNLDTQMYPECKGKPGDRDIVKKTREKKDKDKKKKKKKSKKSFNLLDFKKEAKFGNYLDHPEYDPANGNSVNPTTGRIWIEFKNAGYTLANPPTPEAASELVNWVNQLIDVGMDSILPKDLQKDESVVNGLNRVRSTPQGTPEEIVQKAFAYAGYFYNIEAHGWVNVDAFKPKPKPRF
jgi:hypothetical protein